MIRLAGLRPDQDVQITLHRPAPGREAVRGAVPRPEPPVPTGYPGLLIAAPRTAEPAPSARRSTRSPPAAAPATCMRSTASGRWCPNSTRDAADTGIRAGPTPCRPTPSLSSTSRHSRRRIEPACGARLESVLAHCQFVLGPEVARAGAAAGRVLRRRPLRQRQLRHRRLADRDDGRGHRPRRRRVPAGLHLHRDRRGAAGAGRHPRLRRRRPAHLPDRPRAPRGAASPRFGRRACCGRAP